MKKAERDDRAEEHANPDPSPSEAKSSLTDEDLEKVSGGVRTGDDDNVDDLEIQRVAGVRRYRR